MFRPNRRAVLTSAAAAGLATSWSSALAQVREQPLEQRIGQMLLLGFIGSHAETGGADVVTQHLEQRRVGGVLFLRHNVRTREGAEGSARRFSEADPSAWMAVDQEGGLVQRLSRDLGYSWIPRAKQIVEERGLDGAREIYALGAAEFRAAGFNMNLAPVADLDDPENAVIGRYGRSYGTDGEVVAAYASAFIEAFNRVGAVCSIKHFPGHGTSRGDSHDGFVDISDTWSEDELDPFRRLIEGGQANLIMGGHLTHRGLDASGVPVTFSKAVLSDLLRDQMGFNGCVMTDDLDMAAIRQNYNQREAVIQSVEAGNDIIMMSNSAAPNPELPQMFINWIAEAIGEGRVDERRIDQSAARIAVLKRRSGLL